MTQCVIYGRKFKVRAFVSHISRHTHSARPHSLDRWKKQRGKGDGQGSGKALTDRHKTISGHNNARCNQFKTARITSGHRRATGCAFISSRTVDRKQPGRHATQCCLCLRGDGLRLVKIGAVLSGKRVHGVRGVSGGLNVYVALSVVLWPWFRWSCRRSAVTWVCEIWVVFFCVWCSGCVVDVWFSITGPICLLFGRKVVIGKQYMVKKLKKKKAETRFDLN